MKLKDLYGILGIIGFLAGFCGIFYFMGARDFYGIGGTIFGVFICVLGALSSLALISLSNLMKQNEKQESELEVLKEYLKSKDDSKEFLMKLDKIQEEFNKNLK